MIHDIKNPLNAKELRDQAPAALRKQLTQTDRENLGRSDKYKFFSTADAIDDMAKLGWFPVQAHQPKNQERTKGRENVGVHMVRFRNPKFTNSFNRRATVGDLIPEAWMINSHDGKTAFRFHLALYRTVCGNGNVVRDADLENLKIRHKFESFEEIRSHIRTILKRVPTIIHQIEQMSKCHMSDDHQVHFAMEAFTHRYPNLLDNRGNIKEDLLLKSYDPEDLLKVHRSEDAGNDLYHVYQRVQENLIKGHYFKTTQPKKNQEVKRKARELYNIFNNIEANKGLWEQTINWVNWFHNG